jgi:hypothetical protein
MRTGCFNHFPSVTKKARTDAVRRGREGKSLRLSYDKSAAGWTGYYSLLHRNQQRFTDLSMFSALSFWVKGRDGGEVFSVGMADRDHLLLDDTVTIDEVQMEEFMPGGADTEWRQVVVPFTAFDGLEFRQMASVTIAFEEEGQGDVYLDDVRFLVSPQHARN